MKYIYFAYILIGASLLMGCRSYYQGAFTGSEFNKMPVPIYKADETQRKHYISGGYGDGIKYYKREQNAFKFLGYNYSQSAKHFNFGVGAKLFTGKYNVNTFEEDLKKLNKDYNYWGFQAQCMFGYQIPFSEKFHWRALNWQLSWHLERGEFYQFRDDLIELDDKIELSLGFFDDFTNVAAHGYTEFLFMPVDKLSIGLLGGLGSSVKHMNIAAIIGGHIEFHRFGIQATRTFSSPNLGTSYITMFNGNSNLTNSPWQIGLYYMF